MDWSYDAQHGSTYPIIKFAELTNGLAGVTTAVATATTVDIPGVAPIDVPNIPPIVIPPFPWLGSPTGTYAFMDFLALYHPYTQVDIAQPLSFSSVHTVGGSVYWSAGARRVGFAAYGLYLISMFVEGHGTSGPNELHCYIGSAPAYTFNERSIAINTDPAVFINSNAGSFVMYLSPSSYLEFYSLSGYLQTVSATVEVVRLRP
jgi:hypothetical protein